MGAEGCGQGSRWAYGGTGRTHLRVMKSYRHELIFNLPARRGFVNITSKVQDCIDESGVREGLVLCNSMHISASVFINDHESGLMEDWERWLEKLAPEK